MRCTSQSITIMKNQHAKNYQVTTIMFKKDIKIIILRARKEEIHKKAWEIILEIKNKGMSKEIILNDREHMTQEQIIIINDNKENNLIIKIEIEIIEIGTTITIEIKETIGD